jgi:hypothetical protein
MCQDLVNRPNHVNRGPCLPQFPLQLRHLAFRGGPWFAIPAMAHGSRPGPASATSHSVITHHIPLAP